MHAYARTAIDFAGRTYGPGLVEITEAEYHALSQRGPIRPATRDEIEQASRAEAASAPPVTENAARPRAAARRVRA
ncbi:MAG: hypothetical protein KGL54_01900 [Sphingomonadales bacterium]|nr:hypothetical protein [Sphingomonadales bacterium]